MSLIVEGLETQPSPSLPSSSTGGEALRYLVASVVALALDVGLLFLGTAVAGLPAWVAGAIAYGCGLVLVYVLSIRWVFTCRTVADGGREFAVFAVLGLVGLVLNSATLFIATGLGLPLSLAKLLSAGIGFAANFISRKALLFSGRDA